MARLDPSISCVACSTTCAVPGGESHLDVAYSSYPPHIQIHAHGKKENTHYGDVLKRHDYTYGDVLKRRDYTYGDVLKRRDKNTK